MASVPQPMSDEDVRRIVESTGRFHYHTFQIVIGVLTGLALLLFVGRMSIRLAYQKQLHLDDWFLILAVVCLCIITGLMYDILYYLYLHAAALQVPAISPYLIKEFRAMLDLHKKVFPYLSLNWTAIYAVKATFLAFMRPLVWHMEKVNRFYWFVVWFSVVTWALCVVDPFILCPYFDLEAVKCFYSTTSKSKAFALTIVLTVCDVTSDILVVSLPIIILRGSRLSRSTKFGLITFLCLSIFMAICAIARISSFHFHGFEDDISEFFWQHVEADVAVMMASLTAFRTLFVQSSGPDLNVSPNASTPMDSFLRRIVARFQSLARAKPPTEKPAISSPPTRSFLKLPKLPSPVFTGVRSFIWRNDRTRVSSATTTFDDDLAGLETDYHDALRKQHSEGSKGLRENSSPV